MDFKLSKELQMLQKEIRNFCKKQIAPNVDEWDEKHYLPIDEVMRPLGELGFFGTVIPEEYGGEDMGFMAAMIITEEIAKVSSSLRVQVNMQVLGQELPVAWPPDLDRYSRKAEKNSRLS